MNADAPTYPESCEPCEGRIVLTGDGTIVVELGKGDACERIEVSAKGIGYESTTKAYVIGGAGIVYTRGGPLE